MKVTVRELKSRLSEHLRSVAAGVEVVVTSRGREVARLVAPRLTQSVRLAESDQALEAAIARLRSQPWVRPGKGPVRVPKYVARLKAGEKSLSEIVSEERQ